MTQLCHIDDIPDEATKGFQVGEKSYFAAKRHGKVYLYLNRCPHLGIKLNWMEDKFLDLDGVFIQCFTHGALFLIEDGECVSGPCLGEKLQEIPFTINDGVITLTNDSV